MWLLADEFVDRVQSWWESYRVEGTPSHVLASKLKLLKGDLKLWNIAVFGPVGVRKHTLMADLSALDEVALLRPLSEEERGRKVVLASSLEHLLLMDEISWRPKSRALWLCEGDKNSKFFHCISNSHRHANTISKLQIDGCVSSCQEDIRDHIVEFYESLFRRRIAPALLSLRSSLMPFSRRIPRGLIVRLRRRWQLLFVVVRGIRPLVWMGFPWPSFNIVELFYGVMSWVCVRSSKSIVGSSKS